MRKYITNLTLLRTLGIIKPENAMPNLLYAYWYSNIRCIINEDESDLGAPVATYSSFHISFILKNCKKKKIVC
jgi:hypothetical protein